MDAKRALSVLLALTVATAGVIGAATVADQHTDADLDPVGEADALVGTLAVAGVTAIAAGGAGYAIGTYLASGDVARESEVIQQKIDLYQLANRQRQAYRSLSTITENAVKSTDVKMRIEGMNAMCSAAAAGKSLTAAQDDIAQTLDNRSSTKEINFWNAWSAAALTTKYVENVTDNSTYIGDNFASLNVTEGGDSGAYYVTLRDISDWNKTITLKNGTKRNVTAIPIHVQEDSDYSGASGTSDESANLWITPADSTPHYTTTFKSTDDSTGTTIKDDVAVTVNSYVVQRNQSADADSVLTRTSDLRMASPTDWRDTLVKIRDQNDRIEQNIQSVANAKYVDIKQGTISCPDKVNPYYVSEVTAPSNSASDAFLASWLASVGASNPANWSQVDTVTITNGSNTYYGQLLGQGLPDNTTFREGVTYNSTNITGQPYVITTQGKKIDLTGDWTLDNITATEGNKSSLTFETEQLNASTISGYRNATNYLIDERAESQAREENLEQSTFAVGGLLDGLNIDPMVAIALVFVGLLAVRVIGG